jgi:uncharacterized protein (TIGR02118 family)
MADILVLYGQPKDPAAFDAYYADVHTPLARKMPHLKELRVSKGPVTVVGSDRAFHLVARLTFASMADLQASMASPEGKATADDVPNFASGGVEILIVETEEKL